MDGKAEKKWAMAESKRLEREAREEAIRRSKEEAQRRAENTPRTTDFPGIPLPPDDLTDVEKEWYKILLRGYLENSGMMDPNSLAERDAARDVELQRTHREWNEAFKRFCEAYWLAKEHETAWRKMIEDDFYKGGNLMK
jgi:hypothetical protein